MQTIAFTPLGQDRVPAALTGLELALAVEPVQAAGPGLTFSVSLQNGSAAAISLHDPYDVLTYRLADAGGWPIAQASPRSRLEAGQFVDRSGYLRVQAVRIDGVAVVDPATHVESDSVTIPAGSTIVYELVIDHVTPPRGAAEPTTVVAGAYTLSCMSALTALGPSEPPGATMATLDVHLVVT